MFSGESISVKFRIDKACVNDVVDWFGADVRFSNATDKNVDASVRVNERAFLFWALQYGLYAEVLEPKELREQVRNAAENIAEKYRK
jgi:predicted DNA-binding transcriptional regulator YafY